MTKRPAVVIKLTKENLSAVLSEAGRHVNRDKVEKWLEAHGEGYFLRDESSALNGSLFTPLAFAQIYKFKFEDDGALFREVEKI